jgi:hypothetical protein
MAGGRLKCAYSVVDTADEREPTRETTWKSLEEDDQFGEFLQPTRYTPRDSELIAVCKELRKGNDPADAVLAASNWVHGGGQHGRAQFGG